MLFTFQVSFEIDYSDVIVNATNLEFTWLEIDTVFNWRSYNYLL